jgi:hypothetical protein
MASGYSVTVSVVDNATKQIDAINKRMAAAQAPFNRLSKSLSKFADLSGISKFNDGLKNLVGHTERIIGSIGRLIPALGILTSAASIAGVYKLAESFANLGNKLDNDAVKIGTTATKLQQLQNAARLGGVSAEDMTSSIEGLGQAMQDAMSGKNMQAAALFSKYGIDIASAGYQAKSGAEKIGDAFEIIKKMHEGGASAATERDAMSAMGLSPNMLRFAQKGKAGLEEMNAEAVKFGLLSPEQVKRAEDLQHAITEVQLATEGLTNSIMAGLAPVLTPLLEQFANWIAKNREWIATKAAEYAKQFGDWIAAIDWSQVHKSFDEFIEKTEKIIDGLGGFMSISKDLIELWIGAKVLGMVANLVKMASILTNPAVLAAIAIIAAAMATFKNGQDSATGQDAAGKEGYSEVAGVDAESGMPTSYRNPETGDVRSAMSFDPRYSGMGGGAGAAFGEAPKSSKEMDAKAKEAFAFWTSHGKTPEEAAGWVANEQAESGFNPGARGDSLQAGGSFQWHKDRRDLILKGTGIDVWAEKDANKQREAALWESTQGQEKANGDKVTQDAKIGSGNAGASISLNYERPGITPADKDREAMNRAAIARQRYGQFGPNGTDAAAPSTTPAPPALPVIPANSNAAPAAGSVGMQIKFANAPAGMTTTATGTGFMARPQIVNPMSPFVTN